MPLTESQGLLNGVTFGAGTNYRFAEEHVSGIGVPVPKTNDVNLAHDDGAYAGTDLQGVRIITIPFVVLGSSPSDAMDNFETLAAAWAPGGDETLELYLPGKHFTCVGRPRGLIEDLRRLKQSMVDCIGTFVCLDPTLTPA